MARAPYIGLDYFLEEDADLFFGRSAERMRIVSNLRASRLTLLHAESGVGKSSVLRAGVAALLRRPSATGTTPVIPVVYSAWRADVTADLIGVLEAAAQAVMPSVPELPRDRLEHAIETLTAETSTLALFILDQFEERFLYDLDDGFDDDLARCVTRRDLRAHFLISIREDAYSAIGDRYKARIPNVYGNYLGLEFLDARAAREAIVRPIEVFNAAGGPPVAIDGELVDEVLRDVRKGAMDGRQTPDVRANGRARIETAYLQLVMRRLWDEEAAAGSSRLRLETLRDLGGAHTIIRGHLDEVMAQLPEDERDAAAMAFRCLVTSGGRKIALSAHEVRDLCEVPAAPLDAAIEHLERERILRPVTAHDAALHEIFHDVLAPAILDWRQRHDEERRRAATQRALAQSRERTRRLERRSRRLTAAVVALASLTFALALYLWSPTWYDRAELRTVDARYSLRGPTTSDPRLVLVDVDDQTLLQRAEGGLQLPRREYARLITALDRDRPAVIAVDVVFAGRPKDPDNAALITAFRASRDRLVLPFDNFEVSETDTGDRQLRPELLGRRDLVGSVGLHTGFAGLPMDADDRSRRADYRVDTTADVDASSFAFTAADVATRGRVGREIDTLPRAGRRADGQQTPHTTWIDFAGPPGTLRRVSALDVLEGRTPAGAFAGKLVVVGVLASTSDDTHATPVDREREMGGPEIQANALGTFVRRSPVRDVPLLLDVAAILLLACIPAVAGLRGPRPLVAAGSAAMVCVFLVAAHLAFEAGWVVSVIPPLLALTIGVVALVALQLTHTLRKARRQHA